MEESNEGKSKWAEFFQVIIGGRIFKSMNRLGNKRCSTPIFLDVIYIHLEPTKPDTSSTYFQIG